MENPPTRPMEKCWLDLFSFEGKTFTLLVDCYSQFIMVKEFPSPPNTQDIIDWLESKFQSFGYISHLRMDGGPQMRTKNLYGKVIHGEPKIERCC